MSVCKKLFFSFKGGDPILTKKFIEKKNLSDKRAWVVMFMYTVLP